MELLKEAIFTEEEITLIEDTFNHLIKAQTFIADSAVKEATNKLRSQSFYQAIIKIFPNENFMEDYLVEKQDEMRSKVMSHANTAIGIVTKIHLYKNCLLQDE